MTQCVGGKHIEWCLVLDVWCAPCGLLDVILCVAAAARIPHSRGGGSYDRVKSLRPSPWSRCEAAHGKYSHPLCMQTSTFAYAHMRWCLVSTSRLTSNLCTQADFSSCLMQLEGQSEAACPKGLTSLRRLWCIFRCVLVSDSDLCARSMHVVCACALAHRVCRQLFFLSLCFFPSLCLCLFLGRSLER
jgi:hypothetical protein